MPFDSTLTTKISPLIDGQVPEFVTSDHQVFVNFIKSYYKFLESAEVVLTTTIDHIIQETISTNYILDEKSEKVVTETGSGTTSKFVVDETITGSTSNATSTVLVDDLDKNSRLFITSQQKFKIGETITGSTSGATAVIKSYRGNPVQNIQQLVDFNDPDNTIDTFLNELVNQFLKTIPQTLASDISKRNLIKNIRDLYSAKGTSEGHKLFLRILFDEEAEIVYPNKYMLRASKGIWEAPTKIRVQANAGADGNEIIGQYITGATSGATAMVINSNAFSQGLYSVTELTLDSNTLVGTFVAGETLNADSLTQDIAMSFVLYKFITDTTITNDGTLYSVGDTLDLDSTVGNGYAKISVDQVSTGGVDEVLVQSGGSGYKVGDPLVFTPHANDTSVDTASAVVSVIGGSILLEDTVGNDDYIIFETAQNVSIVQNKFVLDATDYQLSNKGDNLILERTDLGGSDAGEFILTEQKLESTDYYGNDFDRTILEEAAVDASDRGQIKKIFVTHPGGAYSQLPTITITSDNGTGATLYALTSDIGRVLSTNIIDPGFDYTAIPKNSFFGNFVLKDVTGDFRPGDTLTTHTGTVKSWDSGRQLLITTIDDTERIKLVNEEPVPFDAIEEVSFVEQKLQLEQFQASPYRMIADNVLENQTLDDFGNLRNIHIILEDGTGSGKIIGEGETLIRTFPSIVLEGTDSSGKNAGSNLVLDSHTAWPGSAIIIEDGGTDGAGTDAGDNILCDFHTYGPIGVEGDIIIQESQTVTTYHADQKKHYGVGSKVHAEWQGRGAIASAGKVVPEIEGGLILDFEWATYYGDPRAIDNHFFDGTETTINFITEDGDYLIHEEYGQNFLLEDTVGNDDYIIGETERLNTHTLVLNGSKKNMSGLTVLASSDDGSYVNTEIDRDYVGELISGGSASGTIALADVASVSLEANPTITSLGTFKTTDHLISEYTVKLQDSKYYQDFSYEIKIGQSTVDYLSELKAAVHPAGFLPFGKVNLAQQISAAIVQPTAGNIIDFTSDTTTYSPLLASVLETVFGHHLKRRLGANDRYVLGSLYEQILLNETECDIILDGTDGNSANAGDDLLLDGTDGSSTNAGSNIIAEDSLRDVGDGIVIEDGWDGGRLMTEAAAIIPSVIESFGGPETGRDVTLFSVAKVGMRLPLPEPILGTGLQFFGNMSSGGITEFGGIELEDGYRIAGPTTMRDRLLFDGHEVGTPATVVDQGELIELEVYSNPNVSYGPSFSDLEYRDEYDLITESGVGDFYLNYETATPGFSNKRIRTEGVSITNITLGDLQRPSVILADDGTTTAGTDIDAIMPEDALDVQCATDQLRYEDGFVFLQEDRTGLQLGGSILLEHTRFELEDGSDVGTTHQINKEQSNFATFTRPAKIHVRTRGRIAWQDETTEWTFVLNGTDGSSSNAGDNIILDGINSAGVDAGENITSEKYSYQLHPYTYDGGFALINSTAGSSTDAGDYLELESGTWVSVSGSYPVFVPDQPETWDTSQGFFDSTNLSFDIEFGDG